MTPYVECIVSLMVANRLYWLFVGDTYDCWPIEDALWDRICERFAW